MKCIAITSDMLVLIVTFNDIALQGYSSVSFLWSSQPLFWSDPHEAIKSAYSSTNKFILENSRQLGPGGSTAVTAIVVDGVDMWIANIGDSRAVVCERGAANQITVDHEPHTINERKRIEKHGGFVSIFPGKCSFLIVVIILPHCKFV
jgi:serine/threonine protein phosphatase PrpC